MKKPSPKTIKLILELSLIDPNFLKELLVEELSYISSFSNYQIMCFGFSTQEAIRLSSSIKSELSTRN